MLRSMSSMLDMTMMGALSVVSVRSISRLLRCGLHDLMRRRQRPAIAVTSATPNACWRMMRAEEPTELPSTSVWQTSAIVRWCRFGMWGRHLFPRDIVCGRPNVPLCYYHSLGTANIHREYVSNLSAASMQFSGTSHAGSRGVSRPTVQRRRPWLLYVCCVCVSPFSQFFSQKGKSACLCENTSVCVWVWLWLSFPWPPSRC